MAKQNPLEKEIQLAICDYLAMKHYFFWRQNTSPMFEKSTGFYRPMPKYSKNGVPDILLIKKGGMFVGLEVKRPKGKLSDVQIIFQEECKKLGAEYHVVTSIDDVQKLGL